MGQKKSSISAALWAQGTKNRQTTER